MRFVGGEIVGGLLQTRHDSVELEKKEDRSLDMIKKTVAVLRIEVPHRLLSRAMYWISVGWLATLVLSQAARAEFEEVQAHVTEFTLTNGMTFIVLERHQAPVASFVTWVGAGSAYEPKGQTGLAHLFEHMAQLKGSSRIGTKDFAQERLALDKEDLAFAALREERWKGPRADPEKLKRLDAAFRVAREEAGKFVVGNEFLQAMQSAGGRVMNAWTGNDHMMFWYSLPANALEIWFYLEAERLRDLVFREFYKEREVVREERRWRVENYPQGKLEEEFFAAAFKAHPYREPVLGYVSDLENLSRGDAEAFYRRYYVPNNCVVAIVGDVQPRLIRELAEAYFGRITRGPELAPLRPAEPPSESERRVILRLGTDRYLWVGYRFPGFDHPDQVVYDAMASLLAAGPSSRLQDALVKRQALVTDVSAAAGIAGRRIGISSFLVKARVASGHSNEEVERALDGELTRLQRELVSEEELEAVKRRARLAFIRTLEDNQETAMQLAKYQSGTGDWRNMFRYLEQLKSMSPQDMQRAAKATFGRNNRTLAMIEPVEPQTPEESRSRQ